MSAPRASVLMAAYAAEATLREAVDSVLAQTVEQVELIVADDVSPLPAAEVLADVRDPRLRIVRRTRNGGTAQARNSALRHARAPVVCQLDADDLWEPELPRVACCRPSRTRRSASCTRTPRSSGIRRGHEDYVGDASIHPRDRFPELLDANPIPCPTVSMRTTAMRGVGGYSGWLKSVEDWNLYLRLAADGWRFAYVDQSARALPLARADPRPELRHPPPRALGDRCAARRGCCVTRAPPASGRRCARGCAATARGRAGEGPDRPQQPPPAERRRRRDAAGLRRAPARALAAGAHRGRHRGPAAARPPLPGHAAGRRQRPLRLAAPAAGNRHADRSSAGSPGACPVLWLAPRSAPKLAAEGGAAGELAAFVRDAAGRRPVPVQRSRGPHRRLRRRVRSRRSRSWRWPHAAGVPTALLGQGIGPLGDELSRRAAGVLPRGRPDRPARGPLVAPALLARLGVAAARVLVTGDDAIELGAAPAGRGRARRARGACRSALRVAGYRRRRATGAPRRVRRRHCVRRPPRSDAPLAPLAMSRASGRGRRGCARAALRRAGGGAGRSGRRDRAHRRRPG